MAGLKRNIQSKINRLLKTFPVVVILGVRQCGKSTLAKNLVPNWKYFDLEKPAHFTLVDQDPFLFFQENNEKVIVDEAQLLPKLFSVLRSIVDEKPEQNGRYILTGSSSFELLKNISESLAGRVAIVELSTFKMNEFKSESLSNFFNIFETKIAENTLQELKLLKARTNYKEVKNYLLHGGYPRPVLSNDHTFFLDWMENYFSTYINRDMRSLFPSLDILKFQRVIRMLSSLSGTIINKSEIARSAEISEKSVRDYLQIISGTFFWRELPAFKTSKVKTTISAPKGHYRDSGLLFYLQNIHSLEALEVYPKLGNAFESFVVEEVLKGIECTNARNIQAYHYRTKAGAEIDLLLEGSFGLLPIEVKLQSYTTKKQVSALTNFLEHHNLPFGVVINNCEIPSMITNNIIQIPIGCL